MLIYKKIQGKVSHQSIAVGWKYNIIYAIVVFNSLYCIKIMARKFKIMLIYNKFKES